MARFMKRRQGLRTVIAVLLLWQLGGMVASVAAMVGSVRAEVPVRTVSQHCHGHTVRANGADVSHSPHSVPQGHLGTIPGEPPCCQCECSCPGSQGTPAVNGAVIPRLMRAHHHVFDYRNSPPVVSRITEFFRPPI
jgi:hypothetical protein